jgi:hypothetical protein
MSESEDPQDLERKIEQATRIASRVTDQTTVERLRAFAEDLRRKLRELVEIRRTKQEIRTRARELWEQKDAPQAVIWSFGFRPSLRSAIASE